MDKVSKNIVFFAFDALGHIHPLLAIAKELKERGHNVTLLTIRKMTSLDRFRNLGINIEHCTEPEAILNKDESESMHQSVLGPLRDIFRQGPTKAFSATYTLQGGCGKHAQDILNNHDAIELKLRSLKPDLIIMDFVVGVPCATTVAKKWIRFYSAFPSVLYSACNDNYVAGRGLTKEEMANPEAKKFEIETKSMIVNRIKDFFRSKGATVWDNQIEMMPVSPYLNFLTGPNELSLELDSDYKSIDKTWVRLEHTIDEPEAISRFQVPEKLANKPGKLIYFSLGTLVASDTELINKLLAIFSKTPHRYIVSKGQLPDQIDDYPNTWGQKFLDQKAILPQVDLFITHGGNNSVVEAFYYGVPGLIVLPVFADQFDSAQRIQDCGFGKRLNPYDCTSDQLTEAIESILKNDQLRSRMKSISKRLQSTPYHEIAADHVERLFE